MRLLAKELNIDVIWLGVIDSNAGAIGFYQRNGFKFFDKTRLEIPYFKDNLRGMWRMILEIGEDKGDHSLNEVFTRR